MITFSSRNPSSLRLLPQQMDWATCAWSSSNQPLRGSIMTKTNHKYFLVTHIYIFLSFICREFFLYLCKLWLIQEEIKNFISFCLFFFPNDEYEFRVGSVVKAVLQWSKVSICVLAHNEKEPQDLWFSQRSKQIFVASVSFSGGGHT